MQVVPLQQPSGHEVPSQTHCPVVLLHSWPALQMRQPSPAVPVVGPHMSFVSFASSTHELPLQQPRAAAHAAGLQTHTPPVHVWPVRQLPEQLQTPGVSRPHPSPLGHAVQAAPPVPHWPLVSAAYSTHVLPLQQPSGQDVALQRHCPEVASLAVSHIWVEAHATQEAPPVPHSEFDSLAYGTHVSTSQQPAHEVAAPQVQAPPEHSPPVPHAAQAAPPVPHAAFVWVAHGTHVLPLQQPPGHECASQTHPPVVVLHS